MAKSEKSFIDRQARSRFLIDVCEGFEPVFTPGDESLTVGNFSGFLDGVGSANEGVADMEVDYTNSATERVALVKKIREAATQAVSYVKSNKAWAPKLKAAKMAADRLRNMRTPSKPAPLPSGTPGGEPPAVSEKRAKGGQAYVELQAHLAALGTALAACPGYAPPSPDIALGTFDELLEQFDGLNESIGQLASQLTTARVARRNLYYDGEECLERKFQAIKNGVKGQYGQKSKEYRAVKGIKW